MIVDVILFVLTILNSVFIYLVFKEIQMVVHDFDRKLMELHLDNELTEAFDGQDIDDLNKLAGDLSLRVNRQFALTAKTFSELVPQLHGIVTTNKQLKSALIDFFERIIVISYKNEDLSTEDKADLKEEYKIIAKMLDAESGNQPETRKKFSK